AGVRCPVAAGGGVCLRDPGRWDVGDAGTADGIGPAANEWEIALTAVRGAGFGVRGAGLGTKCVVHVLGARCWEHRETSTRYQVQAPRTWYPERHPAPRTQHPEPNPMLSRQEALSLVQEYTTNEALRRHMYAVEIAMRAMAERAGEDPDSWGLVGLVHDFDYERYPNQEHSPTEGHPAEGVRLLAARGLPEPMQRAILGHATYSGVPRDTAMARSLFAVDELAGFLVACALVRPSRSLQDLEVSSVKKKLKDKAFARGVSREDVLQGAAELGVPLDQHIAFMLEALRPHEKRLGLGAA